MRDKFSVRQVTPGVFEFTLKGKCTWPVEVRLLRTPIREASEGEACRLAAGMGGPEDAVCRFEILLPGLDYRPYFLIRERDREYITAERTLPVGGMNNFRDMGGYGTADNRTVRWGMLYRSGHFHNTTKEGLGYLKGLGIHTIIDYRSEDEIGKYPNQSIAPGIRTVRLDPEAHTAELSAQFTSSKEDEDLNLVKKIIEQKNKGALTGRYGIVMEQYRNFAEKDKCKEAFAQMLEIAARPDSEPLVQHCRGGKDRTGFGAMLLLGILGVDRDTLVADYMLTYENRIARNRVKMDIYKKYTDDPEVLGYLYSLIETKPEFIEASVDQIMKTYGTMEQYAVDGLGIGKGMIDTLKGKYLT